MRVLIEHGKRNYMVQIRSNQFRTTKIMNGQRNYKRNRSITSTRLILTRIEIGGINEDLPRNRGISIKAVVETDTRKQRRTMMKRLGRQPKQRTS